MARGARINYEIMSENKILFFYYNISTPKLKCLKEIDRLAVYVRAN